MGDSQGYTMPDDLAKKIKPMPAEMMRLITIKQLNTQAYWVRPVITGARPSACPCCGAIHPMAAHGVCGGCYEPTIKKGLFGPALLDHLARRAKCGKKIRPSGPKAIKKSISPAPESSSPAATPLAGAGQVESDSRPESASFEKVFRIALGLEKDSPVQEFPQHLENLMRERDRFRNELEDLNESIAESGRVESVPADIVLALGLTPFCSVAEVKGEIKDLIKRRDRLVESNHMLEDICRDVANSLDAVADENLAHTAARCMSEKEKAMGKVAELTQEIANLNRLLAGVPSRRPDRDQRETCESILGLLGIGNGFALSGHDTKEDLEAITADLIRGAIADGVWRSDATDAKELTAQDIVTKWSALPVPDGYESLTAVLQDALDQAAHGKGLERHADDRPFHDQPIMRETQAVGLGFPAGEARKKILEAVHCCDDHPERAVTDLLGAINYTAAMVIAIRSMMVEQAAA